MRFGLPEQTIQEIQGALALYPEVEEAILYGSRAMGTFKPGSDIDLTLIGENLTHNLMLGIMFDLDDLLLPWMIDLSIFDTIDHPGLREHIDRVGQTLYER
ncbi:MAG: nucleotidyltransferase domain-containing protein [Desulfomicrobium sp.]|nr:nucleotidyltransferase domain-containing protein [Pseudomonadota bacterium]MBV1713491.1 nucleotidyltransferase domain-containing protein [Desulfomicrobium sp.]MBU4572027.1 nucleotidyltransferase domain-containing protein [Pseudomonadota bacterium]MBU4594005.1 nucleotidyltransferase domain-containing protein [Pseudomonadota bacterium]MBV1721044.1 nucleotidyltransferase domain-containing protein [Desulfomicrobium sp.]